MNHLKRNHYSICGLPVSIFLGSCVLLVIIVWVGALPSDITGSMLAKSDNADAGSGIDIWGWYHKYQYGRNWEMFIGICNYYQFTWYYRCNYRSYSGGQVFSLLSYRCHDRSWM